MRRGLIKLSPVELPDAVLDGRVARLRAAMAASRLDAVLLYTNNTRTAAVSWLSGFVPYWSEGLLLVTRGAPPVLFVALSNRMETWIKSTSRIGRLVHTPRIGLEAGRMIAGQKEDAAVGVVDCDGLPAAIADQLRQAAPRAAIVDMTAGFAALRAKADPAELALGVAAAEIAHSALAKASPGHDDAGAAAGVVEAEARKMGAEEAYIAVAPDLARDCRFRRLEGSAALGAGFALRATIAYKGSWVRMSRTIFRGGGNEALGERAAAQLAAAAAELPGAGGFAAASSWLVEGCRVAQPLEALMGSRVTDAVPPAPGALVSVQAGFEIDGQPILIGAPVLVGGAGEAAALLVPPLFD